MGQKYHDQRGGLRERTRCENLRGLDGFRYRRLLLGTDNVLSKSYNDARYSIGISTENIVLNIDRCRNYADKTLVGNHVSLPASIGDRYERNGKSGSSKIAAGNTYIQNCFSVSQDHKK